MGTTQGQIRDDFWTSYFDSESYPENLIYHAMYLGAIKSYIERLNDASCRLFTKKDDVEVPFRDLLPSGQAFEKRNVFNDSRLRDWLGDKSTKDLSTGISTGEVTTRKDPKCRFIFIGGEHSRSYLRITRTMLLRILSYHQVMPSYIDMISIFGSQLNAKELRFSGFREQTVLCNIPPQLQIPELGRSGKHFQICYHLKTANRTTPADTARQEQKWSIRPAVFYHQFDVEYGTAVWIVTKGEVKDIKGQIQDITGVKGRPTDRAFGTTEECFRSSFSIHLFYCNWATETWRWYIQWLEYRVDLETDLVVFGPRGFDGGNQFRREYSPKDLQITQFLEDKVNEGMMIVESNIEVITRLGAYYNGLVKDPLFPINQSCAADVHAFTTQLDDMICDLKIQVSRARLLVRTTTDRKTLILQHLQSQATDKMERLTSSMHREAIAMRIVTVVTLIYLPATFVSTFFSTDIIKYQNNSQDSNGTFSQIALLRWLQVTLPLTTLTLGIGYLAFRAEDIRSRLNRVEKGELPLYSKADAKST